MTLLQDVATARGRGKLPETDTEQGMMGGKLSERMAERSGMRLAKPEFPILSTSIQ
jgi:hypothetical protein